MSRLEKSLNNELEFLVAVAPMRAHQMTGAYERWVATRDSATLGEYLRAGTDYRVAEELIVILKRLLAGTGTE